MLALSTRASVGPCALAPRSNGHAVREPPASDRARRWVVARGPGWPARGGLGSGRFSLRRRRWRGSAERRPARDRRGINPGCAVGGIGPGCAVGGIGPRSAMRRVHASGRLGPLRSAADAPTRSARGPRSMESPVPSVSHAARAWEPGSDRRLPVSDAPGAWMPTIRRPPVRPPRRAEHGPRSSAGRPAGQGRAGAGVGCGPRITDTIAGLIGPGGARGTTDDGSDRIPPGPGTRSARSRPGRAPGPGSPWRATRRIRGGHRRPPGRPRGRSSSGGPGSRRRRHRPRWSPSAGRPGGFSVI